jgi:hypothetical protein
MTVSKAINTRILIDGYLISSQTNKVSVKLDAQKTDITPFEATAQEFLVLDPAPSIDLSGYIHHSPAAATYDAISHGALDVPVTVTVIRSATSTFTGAPATTLPNATAISLSQDYPVDGVMGIQATWGGATPMRRGIVPYAGRLRVFACNHDNGHGNRRRNQGAEQRHGRRQLRRRGYVHLQRYRHLPHRPDRHYRQVDTSQLHQ